MKVMSMDPASFEDLPPAALGAVGDMLDSGVIVVDDGMVVRAWNHWMEAASGREASEAIGRKLTDLFPSPSTGRALALIQRALAGESVVAAHRFHQYLLELPTPVGHDHYERMQQSARIVPISLPSGRGAAAFINDVTERVAREDELRVAKELAEAASRAKSEFLAAISHELRTPLTAVIGYSDLLQSEVAGPLSQMQKDQISRVKLAAWHLIAIIDEILTFSRVEAHREPLNTERFDPTDLAQDTAALLQPQARTKGLELHVELTDQRVKIETDAGKLRQILLNLLGNAVKFTDQGSVTLHVEMENGCPVFRVTDTGPGISDVNLDRIFEPFTQLDQSATRTKGGTGLGLPLSRKLAELLGGELTVTSEYGHGTTFQMTLPQDVVVG